MATGLNTEEQDNAGSGKGFWGRPSRPVPELDEGEGTASASEAEPGAEEVLEEKATEAQPWLREEEPESLLGPDDEGAVPTWLGLSHVVEAPQSALRHAADDAGSTAPLPPIPDQGVVVQVPHVPEEPAEPEKPVEPSVEPREPEVAPADSAPSGSESQMAPQHVPDFFWNDDLSWDDEVDDAELGLNDVLDDGITLDEPPTPRGYVDVDMGYEEPSVFDGGDTSYLINPTAYDGADSWGGNGRTRLRVIAVVVSVVLALAAVYALGVRRFSNRFLPNTHVNGLDVAGLTVDEARDALEAETKSFACDVSVDDFTASIAGPDVALEREEQAMAEAALASQSAYAWPVALIVAPDATVNDGLTLDEAAVGTLVTAAVDDYNQQRLPTDGANIDYNEDTGLYEVTGTTKGTAVDVANVVSAVTEDMRAFHRTSVPSTDAATHKATVQDIPSYAHAAEYANRARTSDVSILVNGEPVITSEASQNAEWVSVEEGPEVVVDQDAVRVWAEYSVADAVAHSDDWSYYYLNVDAFVSEFSDRLAHGNVDGYEAPTIDELRTEGESREKAYAKGGWNSELGRYIDVDLESQFARLFNEQGEVIWESAFVSGEVYAGRSTVEGVFEIYSKETNTVLVGLDYDGDGAPDYESFVNYWMPFYGGYGLHDATWRANFGGEYYYYYGSHGCVNLPYSKAEELYNITFVGEKVNVHW